MSKSESKETNDVLPFHLTDIDRFTLTQTDQEFEPHSWADLKEIVRVNDLTAFKRYPSQLRRYLSWSSETRARYGSISNFVCQERLHWTLPSVDQSYQISGLEPQSSIPFAHPADYRILRNDWPYAIPSEVVHLVIWLKMPFSATTQGHLLPEAQVQIQAFVEKTFVKPLKLTYGDKDAGEKVLWFKNWSALQSVAALEHFHCFVRDAGEQLVNEWTQERGGIL